MIKFPGKASDFLKVGVAAAGRGDLESVREILKSRPKWIHQIGSHGRTMLWEASHRGKLAMVKYLVKRKANIDACGAHYTPYFVEISCYCIARFKKHHDVADYLESKGAKFDIHTAAFLGDCDAVKKMIRKSRKLLHAGHPQYVMTDKKKDGVSFVIAETAWATPLCYALRGGDQATVEFLISKKAKIKGIEKELFIAADDHPTMVKLLLENGADPEFAPNVFPDDGELFKIVSAYKKTKFDPKKCDELVYLCRGDRGGNPDDVKRMLNNGYDVNFQDHKGKTALHRAAKAGFVETMQILLKHGASIKLQDENGETALFDALRSTIKKTENQMAAIQLLIKSKSNLKHENRKSQTPMMVAQKSKSPAAKKIAKLLKTK